MEQIFIFSCIAGALAIIYGFITAKQVLGMSAGTKKMQEISNAIQEGASAYLKRQYYTIALVGVIIFILIAFFLDYNFLKMNLLRKIFLFILCNYVWQKNSFKGHHFYY